jgi:hypothetical protein
VIARLRRWLSAWLPAPPARRPRAPRRFEDVLRQVRTAQDPVSLRVGALERALAGNAFQSRPPNKRGS